MTGDIFVVMNNKCASRCSIKSYSLYVNLHKLISRTLWFSIQCLINTNKDVCMEPYVAELTIVHRIAMLRGFRFLGLSVPTKYKQNFVRKAESLLQYQTNHRILNCRLLITLSGTLDADQARRIVEPDQGSNCLTIKCYFWKQSFFFQKFSLKNNEDDKFIKNTQNAMLVYKRLITGSQISISYEFRFCNRRYNTCSLFAGHQFWS